MPASWSVMEVGRWSAMQRCSRFFGEGRWQTIRLIDNAHNEHHMHRYAGDVKQDAVSFETGDARDVLPKAVAYLVRASESIIESWHR
jgi:hypothetical protein